VLQLASNHWTAAAHLAPGPPLEAPLDDEIYAAYHAGHNDGHREGPSEGASDGGWKDVEGVEEAARVLPLVVLDDDTVLDTSLLAALVAHHRRKMSTKGALGGSSAEPCSGADCDSSGDRSGSGGDGCSNGCSVRVVQMAGLSRQETVALFRAASVFVDLHLPGMEQVSETAGLSRSTHLVVWTRLS